MDEGPIASSRVAALRRELAAGKGGALEAFWAEVARGGAPLVEPLGDDEHCLVTFLWRATEPVSNVVVVGSQTDWNLERNRMARLPGTDLWYRSYRLRRDARFVYSLSPDDPLTYPRDVGFDALSSDAWRDRVARMLRPDPLNPVPAPGNKPWGSCAVLPGAPAQPWAERLAGAPTGRLEQHRLASAVLGNERDVWVYRSPDAERAGSPTPLLVFFDGWDYVRRIDTPATLDRLCQAGRLPPLTAAFVGVVDRPRELGCSPEFVEFLAAELIPWLGEGRALTADPAGRAVVGVSLGGVAAAFAALRRPDLFGNVLSQSGAFQWAPRGADDRRLGEPAWLIGQYVERERLPVRFYLDAGLMEGERDLGWVPDDERDEPSLLAANRHMRDVLRARGYAVHYAEFNGGHDWISWRGTVADGLLALLGREPSARHSPA
jgi:enterochelin esterase family protein